MLCAVSTPLSPSAADISVNLSLNCVNIDIDSSAGLKRSFNWFIDLSVFLLKFSLLTEVECIGTRSSIVDIESLLVDFSWECFLSGLRSSILVDEECIGTKSSLQAIDSLLCACFWSSRARLSSSSHNNWPPSTVVKPFAGELLLLSVVGVTAK